MFRGELTVSLRGLGKGDYMDSRTAFYVGNAAADQVRDSGWFLGQFVPAAEGLRHQDDVELKWGIHPDGHKRSQPWANGNATTVSILIQGTLKVELHVGATPQSVVLGKQGDYVIFGPDVVHSWEATGHTIVLSVRFPSIEVGKRRAGAGDDSTSDAPVRPPASSGSGE